MRTGSPGRGRNAQPVKRFAAIESERFSVVDRVWGATREKGIKDEIPRDKFL